jgi:hypothetical protein
MAALEDILHLTAWNGYAEDTRQAMYVSHDAFTDERIMFPYGIRLRYGNNRGWVHNLISRLTIAKDKKEVVNRFQDVIKMAQLTHHMKLFKEVIRYEDKNGESALIEAINKISPALVKLIVENGANVNQTDKIGRNLLEIVNSLDKKTDSIKRVVKKPDGKYVIKNIYGTRIKEIRDYLVNNAAFSIQTESDKLKNLQKKKNWDESERIRRVGVGGIGGIGGIGVLEGYYERMRIMFGDRLDMWNDRYIHYNIGDFIIHHIPRMDESNTVPKPKRLKSKQYKQQFGR